jgi:hypothetical protein
MLAHPLSRCSLCGRLHRPLPGRGSAGLETVACSETRLWLCCDSPTSEWRKCDHWAIDAVRARKEGRAPPWEAEGSIAVADADPPGSGLG